MIELGLLYLVFALTFGFLSGFYYRSREDRGFAGICALFMLYFAVSTVGVLAR